MWQHFAVFNAILALSAASIITDMTDICKSLRDGDVVPHPTDCSAYFICGTVPALRYCNDGLHFDALRKVCNWPEHAHCQLPNDAEAAPKPEQNGNTVSSIRLQPVFVAIDVETGKATNPMDKYDAKKVECRHFGAYFLPHPGSCRRYYLCAYGHLHRHKCGRGTAWNYKTQECELNDEAECYSRTVAGMDIDAATEGLDTAADDDTSIDNNFSTTPYPTTIQASTVCFVIDTTIVSGTPGTTFNPTGTYHTATTESWYPTGSGATHTPVFPTSETTWYPTGTYHTATTEPSPKPSATTPRADGGASPATGGLKCPSKGEAYLPNVLDCSKYFICIGGIPVATTCPQGLYWDQNAEFCDLAKNVHCYVQ